MKIQAVTPGYYQNTKTYATPSFNGLFYNARQLTNINIGAAKDGIIGKIKVKNINNKEAFFDVLKWVEYSGLEHYAIQDKKKNCIGEIELIPVKTEKAKYVWVEHLVNYASRYNKERENDYDNYIGIGTKLMQIAKKRSEEEGCGGNIELFSVDSAINFYRKIGMRDYYIYNGRYQQHRMYLPEDKKWYLSHKYGGV